MGLLEDALRGTFEAQVRQPPAVDDPAGRAIASATSVRRRRNAAAALATIACLAMIGAGVAALSPRHSGDPGFAPVGPTAAATTEGITLPVPVLDENHLVLPSWRLIALELPSPVRAWRVADGWLVETFENSTAGLWLVSPGGGTPSLIVDGSTVVISGDGGRVAWAGRNGIGVATRTGATLVNRHETNKAGTQRPVRFVGDGLLLGRPGADGTIDSYELWYPSRGAYLPGPRYDDPILAATPDGSRLYALATTNFPCLVLLVPDGFHHERTACDLALKGAKQAFPSPDGRWLAMTFADRVELYDVHTIWGSAPPTQTWYTATHGLTWVDDGSFVVGSDSYLVRYRVDSPGRGETFVIEAQPTKPGDLNPWVWPVPTLG